MKVEEKLRLKPLFASAKDIDSDMASRRVCESHHSSRGFPEVSNLANDASWGSLCSSYCTQYKEKLQVEDTFFRGSTLDSL
jgi:hypothetical protein